MWTAKKVPEKIEFCCCLQLIFWGRGADHNLDIRKKSGQLETLKWLNDQLLIETVIPPLEG